MNAAHINQGNRIVTPFSAVIEGKSTGLAGCSNSGTCVRADRCLRAAPALKLRAAHDCGTSARFFIKSA